MKRTLLIAALFLGFSVVGFSQTTEEVMEVVVTEKMQVSSTVYVYKVIAINSGRDFLPHPIQAQIAIGTHAKVYIQNIKTNDLDLESKIAGDGNGIDDVDSGYYSELHFVSNSYPE